jgi:hypothetical protein
MSDLLTIAAACVNVILETHGVDKTAHLLLAFGSAIVA